MTVKSVAAVECPCPPWFPNGTWAGKYVWDHEELETPPTCPDLTVDPSHEEDYALALARSKPRTFRTEITYECPNGESNGICHWKELLSYLFI